MRQITEVNLLNIEFYFRRMDGTLYYKYPEDKDNVGRDYQVLDGFNLEYCKQALKNKVKFIWIEGGVI